MHRGFFTLAWRRNPWKEQKSTTQIENKEINDKVDELKANDFSILKKLMYSILIIKDL